MKITLVIIIAFTIISNSYAQRKTDLLSNDISFGAVVGFDLTNLNGKDDGGNKLKNKPQAAYHIGVNIEIPIADEFYVQPNIIFARKGAKAAAVTGQNSTTRIHTSYIDVPINLVYKGVIGNIFIMLGGGPYIAFGVGGNVKTSGTNATVEQSIKFKSKISATEALNNLYLKRVDAGANLFFGYGLSQQVSVQLNAQLGLVNINPAINGASNTKATLKNTNFGLSLGYRF
jgi:hypothetical protein